MMAIQETDMIRVSLYDDNPALRHSLSQFFTHAHEIEFTGAYADALQILENCTFRLPDIILMDIDMPGITGVEAVSLVRKHFPDIRVLMLTVFDDNQNVFQSICNGAVGYILKKTEPAAILAAIHDAYSDGAPMTPVIASKVLKMFRLQAPSMEEKSDLSPREHEILTLLTRGLSYKMIAAETNICIDTVRFHIKKIYEKLQVHSMTEAVSKALRNKWV